MSAAIETPEALAEHMYPDKRATPDAFHRAIVMLLERTVIADREQIAAWCDEKAAEARREAEAHAEQGETCRRAGDMLAMDSHHDRTQRCEGQASALEAVAAMLRGAR